VLIGFSPWSGVICALLAEPIAVEVRQAVVVVFGEHDKVQEAKRSPHPEHSALSTRETLRRGLTGPLQNPTCQGVLHAARAIFPHLAGRETRLDARKTLGIRCFSSNLPTDFGLRAVMGYLPERN
jgi:hypothetical protein